jgi:hypothetical protein
MEVEEEHSHEDAESCSVGKTQKPKQEIESRKGKTT